MSAGRWFGVATSPQLGYSGNTPAPEQVDWGRVAGYAVIFTLALARGGVDDSRLNYANQQAFQHDAQATRARWPSQVAGTTAKVPKHVFSPQQEYRDLGPQYWPIERARTTGLVPPRTLTTPQEVRELQPTLWGSARATVVVVQGRPVYYFATGQTDERLQPSVFRIPLAPVVASTSAAQPYLATAAQLDLTVQPAVWKSLRASGGVDDSRLTFGSQQANLFDQSASRSIWASVVAGIPAPAFLPYFASPQLLDLTQQGSVWATPPPRQGAVPPTTLIAQQAYSDPPSYARAPTPGSQGKVPPTTVIGQQAYTDSTVSYRAPQPARQGAVPPATVIGQQAYTDVPPLYRIPQAAPQGRVPALQWAAQADPSQLPAVIWRSATALVVIPNPVAGFFTVPAQLDPTQPLYVWPAQLSLQGRVPPSLWVAAQVDLTQQGQLYRPQPARQGAVPAMQWSPAQADLTQLAAQLYPSTRATVAIPNPVAPFYAVAGQDESRQPVVVWPALRAGQTTPFFKFLLGAPQADTTQLAARLWSPPAISRALPAVQVWATPQFVEPQYGSITPSVFTPLALPAQFVSASPQPDLSLNYSQVFVLRTFVTAGGQPFRAWVGIGRASSTSGEAGNVG